MSLEKTRVQVHCPDCRKATPVDMVGSYLCPGLFGFECKHCGEGWSVEIIFSRRLAYWPRTEWAQDPVQAWGEDERPAPELN